MQKKHKIMLGVGIAAAAIGAYIYFKNKKAKSTTTTEDKPADKNFSGFTSANSGDHCLTPEGNHGTVVYGGRKGYVCRGGATS